MYYSVSECYTVQDSEKCKTVLLSKFYAKNRIDTLKLNLVASVVKYKKYLIF